MKNKSTKSLGALHPILFFTGLYAIALLFSIFICSALFNSFSSDSSEVTQKQETPAQQQLSLTKATTAILPATH